jgi:hypothetical protein
VPDKRDDPFRFSFANITILAPTLIREIGVFAHLVDHARSFTKSTYFQGQILQKDAFAIEQACSVCYKHLLKRNQKDARTADAALAEHSQRGRRTRAGRVYVACLRRAGISIQLPTRMFCACQAIGFPHRRANRSCHKLEIRTLSIAHRSEDCRAETITTAGRDCSFMTIITAARMLIQKLRNVNYNHKQMTMIPVKAGDLYDNRR